MGNNFLWALIALSINSYSQSILSQSISFLFNFCFIFRYSHFPDFPRRSIHPVIDQIILFLSNIVLLLIFISGACFWSNIKRIYYIRHCLVISLISIKVIEVFLYVAFDWIVFFCLSWISKLSLACGFSVRTSLTRGLIREVVTVDHFHMFLSFTLKGEILKTVVLFSAIFLC